MSHHPFWTPTTDAEGYRCPLAPDDYPSRETALSIVSALDRIEDGTWSELERLTGITNVSTVADRCYHIYGHPELEPATMARRMSDAFMKPRPKGAHQAPLSDTLEQPTAPPHDGYGFTPRR